MIKDVRHYDASVAPVITEKATIASENNQFVFKVARNATKPQIKAAIEHLFDVKVTAVNTLLRKGKNKAFRGVRGRQQDMKKAVVTLADGYRIDMTTGLCGARVMALKKYNPTTPSLRQLVIVDRSELQ